MDVDGRLRWIVDQLLVHHDYKKFIHLWTCSTTRTLSMNLIIYLVVIRAGIKVDATILTLEFGIQINKLSTIMPTTIL